MSIPLQDSVPEEDATRLTRSFKKLALAELLSGHRGVTVRETLMIGTSGHWERAYFVTLKLHPSERIETAFGLSVSLRNPARVSSFIHSTLTDRSNVP